MKDCCMMSKVMHMDKLARQALLYDFYGELLTEHQAECLTKMLC